MLHLMCDIQNAGKALGSIDFLRQQRKKQLEPYLHCKGLNSGNTLIYLAITDSVNKTCGMESDFHFD